MVQAESRFEREFVSDSETILGVAAESGARFVAWCRRVLVGSFSELIVDGVEAENEHVIVDGSEVGNVGISVKLPACEKVVRNFQLAIEEREALLGHKAASIRELSFQLEGR